MIDLRVDNTVFVKCVRKAIVVWLQRRGDLYEAEVTLDGDAVSISLSSKDTGFENERTIGFAHGVIPVSTVTAGSTEVESPDIFDDELMDLVKEQLVGVDLMTGSLGDTL